MLVAIFKFFIIESCHFFSEFRRCFIGLQKIIVSQSIFKLIVWLNIRKLARFLKGISQIIIHYLKKLTLKSNLKKVIYIIK